MKRVLIPGSFDPITVGHYDVIKKCAGMFDEVYVTVFKNTEKGGRGIFDENDCFEMVKAAVRDLDNVHADITDRLVVDYAREKNIDIIVKGIRNTLDFEYEYDLYVINLDIGNYETLFVPACPKYRHISSTFVRDMIKYGRDITPYVPDGVGEIIGRIMEQKGQI